MASPVSIPTEMILTESPGDAGTQMVFVSSLPKDSTAQVAASENMFPAAVVTTQPGASLMAEQENTELTYRTKGNADGDATLLDINQFMEVVYTYKCKFCDFSTKLAHEMSTHVLNVHIEKSVPAPQVTEVNNVTKSGIIKTELVDHVYNAAHNKQNSVGIVDKASSADGGTVIKDNALDLVTNTEHSALPELQDSAANTESACQELFMCGQCTLAFVNIEQCKQHMHDEHNITLLTELETEQLASSGKTDDISATIREPSSDKVSTGTQVMILKKPGRKRKQQQTENPQEDKDTKEILDLNMDFKDEPMDDMAEMPIFNEEFLSEREREGKRRIKIPKSLQHDYYVSSSRENKKASVTSLPKSHMPAQLKKDLSASYNIKCNVAGCKARFQTENSLDEHFKCHNKTESGEIARGFTCSQCTFTSLQWNPVRLHLWMKHSINLDLLSCDRCEYCTDAIHKLEIHKQIHEEGRHYHCETCGKSFKQLTQLMHHSHVHKSGKDGTSSRDKTYQSRQCHICNRIMADSKSLKNHIQFVHQKLRCYSCKFCGHTAARKHMLQVHMRTHTGERPHKCDLCTFATSDHNTLRRHRLRHTGEKPYKCRYCPYACIQAISLKVHMKNKHQNCDGLYYCQICHYHTVNEKNWLQHQEDHKNGLIDEHSQKNSAITDSKKQKFVTLDPSSEFTTNTGTNAEDIQLYEVKGCEPDAEVATNITEIIQPVSMEMNTDSSANIQYVYYTFDENVDKEELIVPKSFLAADGENVSASPKPAFHTVQVSQGGKEGTLAFTLQPVTGGGQQLVMAPVVHEGQSILDVKPEGVQLVGSALSSVKISNQ